jgi:threonine synthase
MDKFIGYTCSLCGHEYAPNEVTYTCPKDGGNLDVALDYEAIRKKYQPGDLSSRSNPSIWRYMPLLPVSAPEGDATPLHLVGGTPMYALPRLGEKLGLKYLWLKDESRNPTASFKDRASAVVVTRAREIGAEVVVTASTGNAGWTKSRHLRAQICSAGQGGAVIGFWRESHSRRWNLRRSF